jgi:tRNA-specific 2-thiouridylase
VGHDDELLNNEFTAAGVNWVAFDEPAQPVRAEVRVRYRHTAAPATVTAQTGTRAIVKFDEPQRAITPGQQQFFIAAMKSSAVGGSLKAVGSRQTAGGRKTRK